MNTCSSLFRLPIILITFSLLHCFAIGQCSGHEFIGRHWYCSRREAFSAAGLTGSLRQIAASNRSRPHRRHHRPESQSRWGCVLFRDCHQTHARLDAKRGRYCPAPSGDDERLLRLIDASADFDRLARARIFLDAFPHSSFRPVVLLLFGDAAEQAAIKLSHDAVRRLNAEEMQANDAPVFSYSLNYAGLDRYNRQGVRFAFDRRPAKVSLRRRELAGDHPALSSSPEAAQAALGSDVAEPSSRWLTTNSQVGKGGARQGYWLTRGLVIPG